MEMPVTSNPLMVMIINMSIVFGVLVLLGGVIRLIRYVDPTKRKS